MRFGSAFGPTGVVEAKVTEVPATGTAAPQQTRGRTVLHLFEQQRPARPAGAGRRTRRVYITLGQFILEPLRRLLKAGRLFREHEVRVAARRGVCSARGSVRECVRVRVRGVCEARTWLAGTRRRSGCARAATASRQARLAPCTLRRYLLDQIPLLIVKLYVIQTILG